MSEVGSLVGDALVRSGQSFSRLCPILRSSHFSAQCSIQPFDLPFSLAEKSRSRFFVSPAGDDHIFQAKINTGAVRNDNLCRFLNDAFCIDRNEPVSTRTGSKSCPFDRSLDRLALVSSSHIRV